MSEEEKKKTEEKSGTISRREFLKDAGLVVGGATIGSMAILSACTGGRETTKTITQTVTATAPLITKVVEVAAKLNKLTVNGTPYELKIEPNWTLAFVLREKLGLTGTKISCERASCGVCTVIIDGNAVLSCTTLAIECEGRAIETIEDLADGLTLHPIQKAFIENFGLECGYCTPGIIMATKALLDRNSNPTEQDVKEALSGNICKCGTYKQITASALAAASMMKGG